MNAAERFVWGRGSVGIEEFAHWWGRAKSWAYLVVARGELRKAGPGRITSDSVVEFYAKHNGGGAADEVKKSTSTAPVPVAGITNSGTRHKELRRVTGAASFGGGAR